MSNSRDFWERIRQAALMFVDAIEREYAFEPRTAELRKLVKALQRELAELRGPGVS